MCLSINLELNHAKLLSCWISDAVTNYTLPTPLIDVYESLLFGGGGGGASDNWMIKAKRLSEDILDHGPRTCNHKVVGSNPTKLTVDITMTRISIIV